MNPSAGIKPASRRQIAKGAAWLMLFKIVDRGIGLLSTLILARLLVPSDFGLVAMASSVVALTELMGAFGFDTALIQRQDARREHYDTAWTFTVILGLVIAIALVLLAAPAAAFYRDPRLETIIPILALGALISGCENIGTVAFRKELDFDKEFRFLLFKRLSGFLVTVALAAYFRTYWALIAGIITAKSVALVISYLMHPYRPKLCLAARNDLLHFSKWLFISNLINFFRGRSTDFILGRTVGTHGLGIFNVAAEIAMMPATELIAPINRAVYPAYSRLNTDLKELRKRFLEVFGIIGLVATPASLGLISIADLAVQVLLGDQWLEAIPIVRIVAGCGLIGALLSNMQVFILAIGKPKASTYLSGGLLVFSLPITVYCSIQFGLLGAAWAYAGVSLFTLIGTVAVFTKLSNIDAVTLGGALWRPFACSIAMALIVYATNVWLIQPGNDIPLIARFFSLIFLGMFSYTTMLLIIWQLCNRPSGAESTMLAAAENWLRKH